MNLTKPTQRAFSKYSRGQRIPDEVKDRIRDMLASGQQSVAQISRAAGVSYGTVRKILDDDPDLAELHADAWNSLMDDVEAAGVDLAINGGNEIAREKMVEYFLRYRRPKVYNPESPNGIAGNSTKKVVIMPVMPVRNIDKDGIPIEDMSPNKATIDV